jgi:hypothetical protein
VAIPGFHSDPSSHDGWVKVAKRGLLGEVGLNRGSVSLKRGLEIPASVTEINKN